MYPTALPDNPFLPGAFHEAYSRCLTLQTDAETPQAVHVVGCPPPLVSARLLGHLLRLAPTGNPQRQVQRGIALAKSDTKLVELAAHFVENFICGLRHSGGPTPTPSPSNHPSRPSFEDAREHAMLAMQQSTMNNRQARTLAMYRDDNCCMITRKRDYRHGGADVVETAHIIPQSINRNIEEHSEKRVHSGGVWATLSMFDQDNIIEQLAGNAIHRPENVISLNSTLHHLFDHLQFCLKPVEHLANTYQVCTANEVLRTGHSLPELVTFSTATNIPLPHRGYLALHALCCEVAWMSGAAEYVMDVERIVDDMQVLPTDGSGLDILMAAFSFSRSL